MSMVPRFALYGTDSAPAWLDFVHIEHIPERSSLYDFEIEPHVHDGLLQLLYVVAGSATGEVLMDHRRWRLSPPCVVIVPAGVVHGFRFPSDVDGPVITAPQRSLESLVAALSPELLAHIRTPRVMPVDARSPYADDLMPLFEAIERESRHGTAGHVASGMALLAALLVQISRISQGAAVPSEQRSRKALQIEHFRRLVDERFRTRRSVAHYAEALGVSVGHLGRLCRDVLGISPLDAINERLLHEAQRELVYSSVSIKQLAWELGFEDEAYFGRFFKKHTKQRPTEFRTMARRHLAMA